MEATKDTNNRRGALKMYSRRQKMPCWMLIGTTDSINRDHRFLAMLRGIVLPGIFTTKTKRS